MKAVAGLHARNILHRDIKLDNIMVSESVKGLRVHLADLGSAVKLSSPTATSTFMIGTPGYIAPEMLCFKPISLPYDIWSLGAIMYCLLTH